MSKIVKSAEELHELIVTLVRRYPEYALVTPGKPYWHERDTDGCNWNLNSWTGPAVDVSTVASDIETEVLRFREKYDIVMPG